MGLPETNYILSNINAIIGSTAGAIQARNRGVDPSTASMNFGLNVMNGIFRNSVAYDMRKVTGSNLGFMVNNLAGYGSPEANAAGTSGLMNASVLSSIAGPYAGWYGGGVFGPSMFGGYFAPPVVPTFGFFSFAPPMPTQVVTTFHSHRHFVC